MIPKIIHFIWMDFKNLRSYSLDTMPQKYRFNIERCKFINPGYEIKIWSGGDCYDLIRNNYPKYFEIYESLIIPIIKCDMARFIILYHYGGIYSDCDRICQNPYDGLVNSGYDVILAKMPFTFITFINHDVMLSKPKSDFIFRCLESIEIKKTISNIYNVAYTAGGDFITNMYKSYSGPDKIMLVGVELQPCSVLGCESSIINAYSYADVVNMSWLSRSTRDFCDKVVPKIPYFVIFLLIIIIIIIAIYVIII